MTWLDELERRANSHDFWEAESAPEYRRLLNIARAAEALVRCEDGEPNPDEDPCRVHMAALRRARSGEETP